MFTVLAIAIGVFLGLLAFVTFISWLPGFLEDHEYKKEWRKATGQNPW